MHDNPRESIVQHIRDAFATVVRGDGRSIHDARLLDDYHFPSPEVMAAVTAFLKYIVEEEDVFVHTEESIRRYAEGCDESEEGEETNAVCVALDTYWGVS